MPRTAKKIEPKTFLYCFASGHAEFGRKIPIGAIVIDFKTDSELQSENAFYDVQLKRWEDDPEGNPYPRQKWQERMSARMRLAYDGKTMLVPGIPEAANQTEALAALEKFKSWAVQ